MRRIEWIDFGKGITIFFVMLAHVFEGVFKTGNYPQYDSFSTISMAIIFTFIMPVFFALSGFLYKSPKNKTDYFKSLKKKAINLFIPYLIFSFIYVFLQHMGNSVNNLNSWASLLNIWREPIGYLWFLYILFFIFGLVGLLDLLKINHTMQISIYFTLFIVSQFINMPYVLAGTFTWTICFYIGFMMKSNDNLKITNNTVLILAVALIGLSLFYQYSQGGTWYRTNTLSIHNFVSKIISIPVLFYLFSKIQHGHLFNYFTKFGKYSLIIYLVHAPITSIVRTVFLKFDITNYFVLIIGISIFTWLISVLICQLSRKVKIINMIFYPYKYL